MKKKLIAFFFLLSTIFINALANETAHFAYISEGMSKVTLKDVQLGYAFLLKRYGKKYGYNIEIAFDSNAKNNIKLFQEKKLDYLGMTACTFAKYYQDFMPYTGAVYLSSHTQNLMESYVVLGAKSAQKKSIKDYQNANLFLQEFECNAIMYANEISETIFHKKIKQVFHVKATHSPNQAILKLYFGKAQIAIVPAISWQIAQEMNPAVKQRITVLQESPKQFLYGVEIYHIDISNEIQSNFKKANNDVAQSEEGQQLLHIMKVRKREEIDLTQLEKLLHYYFVYNSKYAHAKVNP